jgi:hypothetical protein
MNRRCLLVFTLSVFARACQGAPSEQGKPVSDPYLPSIQVDWTGSFQGVTNKGVAYRFSAAQLAAMSNTKLDLKRVRAYMERTWPIDRLKAFCVPTNIFPSDYQNLVPVKFAGETDIHNARAAGFDRIWVYLSQDDGKDTEYVGTAGTDWHRWKYSLNMKRGMTYWVIMGVLPNDFMDSDKYKPSEPAGATNRSQQVRPQTNQTSAAARSGR